MSYRREILRIFKQDGIRGFSKGYQSMLVRDVLNTGIYFTVFEFNKALLGVSDADRANGFEGLQDCEIAMRRFLSGGLSALIT